MSIDLGLEYLQVNKKPNGSLFEAYNEFEMVSDELRESAENLIKSIDAFDNVYNLKRAINKYGRTRSLEAFVGSEVIASCEAEESWIKRAWNAVKEFFRKLWTKFLHWIKTSDWYTNRISKKLEEIEKKDIKSDAKFKVHSISKKYGDELNRATQGLLDNEDVHGITIVTIMGGVINDALNQIKQETKDAKNNSDSDTNTGVQSKSTSNDSMFEPDPDKTVINRGAYDSKIDKEGVEVTGSNVKAISTRFKSYVKDYRTVLKGIEATGKAVSDTLNSMAKAIGNKEALKEVKKATKAFARIVTYTQESYLANIKVINSFISGASKVSTSK